MELPGVKSRKICQVAELWIEGMILGSSLVGVTTVGVGNDRSRDSYF